MADTKISALPAASVAALANEYVINEAGVSKKVTGTQLKTLVSANPTFTGEVILPTGGTADAPVKFVAGTNLSSAEVGAVEFDGTAYYFTVDTTSGRTQIANHHMFRPTANLAARGPTIADFFDANSAFPIVASGVYELLWDIYFLKTTNGTVTFTITSTQAFANLVASWRGSAVGGIAAAAGMNEAGVVTQTAAAVALPVTSGNLSTANNHHYIIRALAENDVTAGNVRLRITSSAGTVTPLRGSFFMARRLDGNAGTFVA